jgi:protein-disulfide isomerase
MRKEILILGAIIAVVIIAVILGSNYYRSSIQSERKPMNTTATAATAEPRGQLIRPDSPTLGPSDAKVTLVEFYDPECESCAAFSPIVKKILKDHKGKIRFVARYMPLHPNSRTAAAFTEVAGEQGKYWQARELLFQKQSEWGEKHGEPAAVPPDINALFDKYARELGLDLDKAALTIKENRFAAKIERDKEDGRNLGVRKTPTFFVNGRQLARFGESDLRRLIDEELKK